MRNSAEISSRPLCLFIAEVARHSECFPTSGNFFETASLTRANDDKKITMHAQGREMWNFLVEFLTRDPPHRSWTAGIAVLRKAPSQTKAHSVVRARGARWGAAIVVAEKIHSPGVRPRTASVWSCIRTRIARLRHRQCHTLAFCLMGK